MRTLINVLKTTKGKVAACVVVAAMVVGAPLGWSQLAVLDIQNLAETKQQLSSLNQQIAVLKQHRDAVLEQGKAIGDAAKVTLQVVNLPDVARSLQSSLQCMIPTKNDLQKMLPSGAMEDLNIRSACQMTRTYGKYFFTNDDASFRQVQLRRDVLEARASIQSLGQADASLGSMGSLNSAIDQLDREADAAEDMNERLAVIAKGQVVLARAAAGQTQLLAQMLKLQAAYHLKHSNEEIPQDYLDLRDDG